MGPRMGSNTTRLKFIAQTVKCPCIKDAELSTTNTNVCAGDAVARVNVIC